MATRVLRQEIVDPPSNVARRLVLLDSVAYLTSGRPFEQLVALQRGDRTSIQVEFLAAADDLAERRRLWS